MTPGDNHESAVSASTVLVSVLVLVLSWGSWVVVELRAFGSATDGQGGGGIYMPSGRHSSVMCGLPGNDAVYVFTSLVAARKLGHAGVHFRYEGE